MVEMRGFFNNAPPSVNPKMIRPSDRDLCPSVDGQELARLIAKERYVLICARPNLVGFRNARDPFSSKVDVRNVVRGGA
jgi:hypothetical protein